MRDDFIIEVEARIPEQVVSGLAKLASFPHWRRIVRVWGRANRCGVIRRLSLARALPPILRATLAASETIELRLERRRWTRVRCGY
jgi:hypothetical protein